ncbi:hypothetical protein [Clostridium kluyveri]|uniref:Uncharacterized protein n=1 Tax=Clostridium kluyveri TaxID=1534 RepID=A0A1L5FEI0_CLOKL|nr:hypothetical protein [Clostridium kluyveri]APM41414.1 hypothetical protein BS101_22175 [Clostridium kluyveri]
MDIKKAIENMESHIKAYEDNLRSIKTVNDVNKDWDGIKALGQPISTTDKIYVYTAISLETCRAALRIFNDMRAKGVSEV